MRDQDGFQKELPGYPTDANVTQFDFKMKNLPSMSYTSDDNLRYAVEVVMFTVNNVDVKKSDFELSKSIDDEHSPGVFETWAAKVAQTEPKQLKPCQSFIAWKPVAYNGEEPGFENKALAYNNYWVSGANKQLSNQGHFELYEGEIPWTIASHKSSNHFGVNVTFGQQKDGGYLKSKFLQW